MRYKHARCRRVPVDHLSRQVFLARRQQPVSAPCVFKTQVDQPLEIAGVAPGLVEQLVQDDLGEAAGVLRGALVVSREAFGNLLRRRDPARARAGRDHFGEGVHPHHAPIDVHAEYGGD